MHPKTPPHPPELSATVPPRQVPSHYGEQPDDQQQYLSVVLATGPPAQTFATGPIHAHR